MKQPPLRRVLVATDFSPNAEKAIERTSRLALEEDAVLHLLHVVPALPPGSRARAVERAKEALDQRAKEVTARVRRAVTSEVLVGESYVEIIRAARRREIELTVLGRHAKERWDWGLGTTAERVVRMGNTAVLVVGPQPVRPYEKPVVALDLSEVSPTLLGLARKVVGPAVPLRLVHAYGVPFEGFLAASMPGADFEALRAEYRDQARGRLKSLLTELGEDARAWQASLSEGEPRLIILRKLAQRGADVVVVGTHGRTGLARVLVGSVAEWIVRNASCDVLVVRPERFAFEAP